MSEIENTNDGRLRVGSLFSGYGGLDLAVEGVFDARTGHLEQLRRTGQSLFPAHVTIPLHA